MTEEVRSGMFSDPLLGPREAADLVTDDGVAPSPNDGEALFRAVRTGGLTFALPDASVVEWQTLEGDEVSSVRGARSLQIGDDRVPLLALEQLLPDWLERPCAPPVSDRVEVLVIEQGGSRVAVSVELVDDPIELEFTAPADAREGAVLGAKVTSGGVVFILDPAEILRIAESMD